jgi:hypothetical protein
MWRTRMSIAGVAEGCLLLLSFTPQAAGQCHLGSNYLGIAVRSGNPFQAEKVTTFTREPQGKIMPSLQPPALIARDSQGRVRVEVTEGKFKVEEGEGAETETVQQMITICDPVSQKLVRLDTLSKTATVTQTPELGSLRSGIQPQVGIQTQRTFCSVLAPMLGLGNTQKEDLGRQTIEGLDAQGMRGTRPMPAILNGEATTARSTTELWCSEELGALLLLVRQTRTTQTKMEMKLTKIVPGEPDPALFQIPPDYRIVERVPEERRNGQLRPSGAGPAIQPST